MPTQTISYNNLASIGLVTDVDPLTLPSDDKNGFGWSASQNFRFKDGAVQKMPGYSLFLDTTSTITPYYSAHISNAVGSYYLYAGYQKVYCYFSGTHYNITRQTASVDVNYNASADNQWNMCILNSLPVFNNGVDAPQMWATINQGTKLTPLTAWTAGYTANVIRSFKAYLVALNVTNAVPVRDMNKVKWSAAALPGQLPTSWDITDPTNDAAEITLADTPGYLVDCLPLGDNNIIYKSTSTYMMSYVGGNSIFAFQKIFPSIGMLAPNCAAEFEGKHFVVTNNDVIVHDGHTYQSVIAGKNKKKLFANISASASNRTFVVPNYGMNEMWICYPTGSSTYPNNVLIYNYDTGAWTQRLMPETSFMTCGFVDLTTSVTWNSQSSLLWKDASMHWSTNLYSNNAWTLTMTVPADKKLYTIDLPGTNADNGTTPYCYLERQSMFPADQQNIKLVKQLWPKITQTGGTNTTIDINIGTEMTPGNIVWQGPYAFNIGTDTKVDFFATGRNISVRFSSNTDVNWNLNGFDLLVDNKGLW